MQTVDIKECCYGVHSWEFLLGRQKFQLVNWSFWMKKSPMRWKSIFIFIKLRNYKIHFIANFCYLNKCWELLLWLLLFPRTVLATATVGAPAVSAGARSAWATAAVWKWKIFYWNIKYYTTYCLALCSSDSLEATWGSWERIVGTDSGPPCAVIYIETSLIIM